MSFFARTFLKWLPLGIAITLTCVLIYAALQQNYRQSLNDPQIQIAEDTANALANGSTPEEVIPTPGELNLADSLSPWVAVYSNAGVPLVSSGELNGDMPMPPQGVFAAAKSDNGKDTDQQYQDRVTWQAGAGLREALVVAWVPQKDEYVAAGRDMSEVEDRESRLGTMVGLGWVATMIATLFGQAFSEFLL